MNEIWTIFFSFLVGACLWTLAEYLIHRGLGHKKNRKNMFTVEHLKHHKEVNHFSKTSQKVRVALGVVSVMIPVVSLVTSWLIGLSFSIGFITSYLLYEIIHRRIHTHAPQNKYGEWIRKHHFHHHFKNPRVNHGVTTPFWDWFFGTLEAPNKVRVPRKFILNWMVDQSTGGLLKQFQDDYEYYA